MWLVMTTGVGAWSDEPGVAAEQLERLAREVGVPIGERGTLADGRPVVWFRIAHASGFAASVGMMIAGTALRCTATQFTEDFAGALQHHDLERLNGPSSCVRVYPSTPGHGHDVTVSAPVLHRDATPNVQALVSMLLEACASLGAGVPPQLPRSFPTPDELHGACVRWLRAYAGPCERGALEGSASTPQNRPAELRVVFGPGTVALVASSPNPELGPSLRRRSEVIARANHMAPAGAAFWDEDRIASAVPLHPWAYEVRSQELDWAAQSILGLLDLCAYLGK